MGIENFIAREKGMELVVIVYKYTKKLPQDEKHVLIPQLRRAVLSIPLNLSEGYGRSSKAEFARFADIALGSIKEVQTLLEICQRLDYSDSSQELESTNELSRIVFSLIRSLRGKSDRVESPGS